MKNIHQNAIKYLTYLVLNKRKIDNKQTPVPPPQGGDNLAQHPSPPPKGGITPYTASRDHVTNIGLTGSYSHRHNNTGIMFSFLVHIMNSYPR